MAFVLRGDELTVVPDRLPAAGVVDRDGEEGVAVLLHDHADRLVIFAPAQLGLTGVDGVLEEVTEEDAEDRIRDQKMLRELHTGGEADSGGLGMPCVVSDDRVHGWVVAVGLRRRIRVLRVVLGEVGLDSVEVIPVRHVLKHYAMMAEVVTGAPALHDARLQHLKLLRLDAQEILHGLVSLVRDDLLLQIFHKEDQQMTQHEHAEQQQDTGEQRETADMAVPDRAGEQQDHRGRDERKEPRRHPEIMNLDGHQRLQDLVQKCRHRNHGTECHDERHEAGLPAVKVDGDVVLAEEEGRGADRQQIVDRKNKMKEDDPPVRPEIQHHQHEKQRGREVLHVHCREAELHQKPEDAHFSALPEDRAEKCAPLRKAETLLCRQVPHKKEWKCIQCFVDDQFGHSACPSRSVLKV